LIEIVFAIPTDKLWNLIAYKEKGFIPCDGDILQSIVKNGLFQERDALEENSSFKQLIPYAIISCKESPGSDDRQIQSYYIFKRIAGQKEKRLQNRLSLGVGGHMNPDRSVELKETFIIDELKRELFEEIKLRKGCIIEDIEFIGLINDDTISVGKVHLGLLYNINVSSRGIDVKETDKMTGEWVEKSDLAKYCNRMETWSKIAFDFYIK
jgi:predicted NUDIX family phosphoesterase